MYKVLIVDDEPLARMGISSMLENCDLPVEITGLASNGKYALDCMEEVLPDIVITDIRMPVLDGLALFEKAKQQFDCCPEFIFLTSYEDFAYVKKALYLSACRYLIKMELSAEALSESVSCAIERLGQHNQGAARAGGMAGNVFINRFYNNLLNGAYHSEEEILDRAKSYNQQIEAGGYLVASTQITFPRDVEQDYMQQYNLYLRILDTISTSVSLHTPCFVVAYHRQCIAVVLMLQPGDDGQKLSLQALQDANKLSHQYFGVKLLFGIGGRVEFLQQLPVSFTRSQNALLQAGGSGLSGFVSSGHSSHEREEDALDISRLDKNLIRAFEHVDTAAFNQELDSLAYKINHLGLPKSINALSCVVHVVINCLDNGEKILARVFEEIGQSYQMLYTSTTTAELLLYLERVRMAVVEHLQQQTRDPKYALVASAKAYIRENCFNKLSLGEVAAAIGISQNYLSGLFRQYSELGFSEYVTNLKVKAARELLAKGDLKVYQVSEKLGFETPHYFSKVYKKFTGYSPSEVVGQAQERPR